MKTLVVGGSGLIGGTIALALREQGHSVTIMARNSPTTPVLAEFDFLQCDYIHDDLTDGRLDGFEALVFSAAADIRNVPMDGSIGIEAFYQQANDIAVPQFFKAAREAGIGKAVYIGTFYPQVAAQKIGSCPYVTSRHNTDQAVRSLATDDFRVCSLNAPFVLGHIAGLEIPHIDALIAYAKGALEGLPLFAPKGGTNHISAPSLAQATLNALKNAEPGRAYLVGDQNFSWKEYLEMWCTAAGNPQSLEVLEDDHPMLPNVIMFAGAGATISYQPNESDLQVLNYARNQIKPLIEEIVAAKS